MKLPLVLLFSLCCLPPAAKAQESQEPDSSSLELDAVVVTSQKTERSLADTDSSVSVVFPGANDGVAGAADDMIGILERLPNVAPFQSDGGISIRGVGSAGFGFGETSFILTRGPNDLITTTMDGIPVSIFAAPFGF